MPLLRAISYHLLKHRNELDIKSLTDCLFALNQLNFKDTVSIIIQNFVLEVTKVNLHSQKTFLKLIPTHILIQNLLEGISDSLEQKLTELIQLEKSNDKSDITQEQQVMLARSILTSLGQMKFRHTGLLDNLCKLITSKIVDGASTEEHLLKTKDFASFLMTTASLDYCPKNSETLYEVCMNMERPEPKFS